MFSWRSNVKTVLVYFFALLLCVVVLSAFLAPPALLQSRVCTLSLSARVQALRDACSKSVHDSGSELDSIYVGALRELPLGVAASVHIVSLKTRNDRRERMERLRRALGLDWKYFDAVDKGDALVDKILTHVRIQRTETDRVFEWPDDIGKKQLGSALSRLLAPAVDTSTMPLNDDPLLCATGDNVIPTYTTLSVPFHMILSRGMLACWYSHVKLMELVAANTKPILGEAWDGREGVAIVFEDDIDVEWDLEERLKGMWGDLPRDWDIVMLGHCWSDESTNPPLAPASLLHPSHAPKCTHGYALSPQGVRRLLAYLTYPPFAFSRALDQAIAHLIRTGRVRSYSVVPSVVVQRRCRGTRSEGEGEGGCEGGWDSDIWIEEGRRGSSWRETLANSALDRIERSNTEMI